MRLNLPFAAMLSLAGCATVPPAERGEGPVAVKVIGFNDFHGNLEPPALAISAPIEGQAEPARVPGGGAAYMATALQQLRAANSNNATVSAGDMVGASPLVSSMFLDEPTIHAMNLMKIDYNAVGNHEFDNGRQELVRLQQGGCPSAAPASAFSRPTSAPRPGRRCSRLTASRDSARAHAKSASASSA
jgi:5'-nucleotidase